MTAIDIAAVERRAHAQLRRDLGSWFTAPDVTHHIAWATIGAAWLDAIGHDADLLAAALLRPASMRDVVQQVARNAGRDEDERLRGAVRALHVLDPSCGAGAFLLAAWQVLVDIGELVGAPVSASQLHGLDIDSDAISACRMQLVAAGAHGVELMVGDAVGEPLLSQLPDLAHHGGADVVIGNPPWVRRPASAARIAYPPLATAPCGNLYAWIVERSLQGLRPGGRFANVVPISAVCTDAFAPLRAELDRTCSSVHTSHFDTIPSSLFPGVVQRLSIVMARAADSGSSEHSAQWYTSRYHRWRASERDDLLTEVEHVPLPPQQVNGSIAKIGTRIEADLLAKLFIHPPLSQLLTTGDVADAPIFYKRRWSYFLLVLDAPPPIWTATGEPREASECRTLHVAPEVPANVVIALLNSTLFWWYFSVFTDNRNVNRRDIDAFPFAPPEAGIARELDELGRELMLALHACSEVRTCTYRSVGTIHNTYYRQGETRPVIDRIDAVLARHYGLCTSELDFILSFEQRFRSAT